METPKHTLPRITPLLHGLEKTNEYLDSLKGLDRFQALGQVAGIYAGRMESEKPKTPSDMLNQMSVNIMSSLPGFIEGARRLNAIDKDRERGHTISKTETTPLVEAVIPFNHGLRTLIDTFPEFTFEQVQNYCSQMTFEMSGPTDAAYCKQAVRERLVGMRTEIGMSQVLWEIEEVQDVRAAETAAEEMNGIDLIVDYRDKTLNLDAKASETGVKSALEKRSAFMTRHSTNEAALDSGYPVYPGIKYEDFSGGFRIDAETARRLAPHMKTELERIYHEKFSSAVA